MNTTIKHLNEKTDNRFIYALGLICLLSICISEFPERANKTNDNSTKIIMAEKTQSINSSLFQFRNNV